MKKFLHVAFGLLVSATAMAQQPAQKEQEFKTPEERAKFQTEKMASELQLTAAQKEQVYTINLGIAQKNEGIRTSTFSEEEKRSIIKSNREAQIEMLKNVLTAAQFEKMKAEIKEQHTQGGKVHNEKHWSTFNKSKKSTSNSGSTNFSNSICGSNFFFFKVLNSIQITPQLLRLILETAIVFLILYGSVQKRMT